jgi:hypothetical protein
MRRNALLVIVCVGLFLALTVHNAPATTTYIKDFANFPAYPYNTGAYQAGGAYVGCGPTTGAMIFGYFQNEYGAANLLTPPTPTGVNQGLQTAWALHGNAYMQTGADGFGSVYRIEPGLEQYAADRGYVVDAMIHVSPTYTSPNPTWDAYGPFGKSWTNDGTFWQETSPGVWDINKAVFSSWVASKLTAGTAIFLTIDHDATEGGDHWVPLVGVDDDGHYYFYDTYDTSVHMANIAYYARTMGGGDDAISLLRTVDFQAVPLPPTLLLLGSGLLGMAGWRRFRKS